ncbi:unnamed protein product [Gongylonema pulchrum]|uniref:Secreted protein n=1 Tax=Gongylonema pulchrum TaxID=637853 RepID=A0A183DLQ9_9BILA|nr:unnamed protein product [Gongylonema pulchrum]
MRTMCCPVHCGGDDGGDGALQLSYFFRESLYLLYWVQCVNLFSNSNPSFGMRVDYGYPEVHQDGTHSYSAHVVPYLPPLLLSLLLLKYMSNSVDAVLTN